MSLVMFCFMSLSGQMKVGFQRNRGFDLLFSERGRFPRSDLKHDLDLKNIA